MTGINSESSIVQSTPDTGPNLHEQAGVPHARQILPYDNGKKVSRGAAASSCLQPLQRFERHYSVKELAELWNLSDRTVRRMFLREPGVLEWGTRETRMKRGYKTVRIPESVAQRVYRKLRRAG